MILKRFLFYLTQNDNVTVKEKKENNKSTVPIRQYSTLCLR